MALKKAVYFKKFLFLRNLLRAGIFGDSFGTFGDGVFGQFTWKQKSDSSLDFARADGASLVVMGQSGSLGGDSFKDVVDEGVHDGHGFGGDSGVWVDLLQDFVDVDGEAFLPLCSSFVFLVSWSCFFDSFFGAFSWCHFEIFD